VARPKQPILTIEQSQEKYGFDITIDEIRTKESHCFRGHRLVEENIRRNGKNQRLCWICEQQRRGRIQKSEGLGFTHCKYFHELTEENLVLDGTTWRCKRCISRRKRDVMYGKGAGNWFEEKVLSTNSTCELCEEKVSELVLDHDHETGRWRGVLCDPCNKFLGKLEKRLDILDKVLDYIKERKL